MNSVGPAGHRLGATIKSGSGYPGRSIRLQNQNNNKSGGPIAPAKYPIIDAPPPNDLPAAPILIPHKAYRRRLCRQGSYAAEADEVQKAAAQSTTR